MKHKVKMIHTIMGRDDNALGVETYVEGNTYEIGGSLLQAFVQQGAAKLVDESQPEETKVDAPKETKRGKKAK